MNLARTFGPELEATNVTGVLFTEVYESGEP
jgi:hypothetical protein